MIGQHAEHVELHNAVRQAGQAEELRSGQRMVIRTMKKW
jgi:hypothetical protein